MIGFGVYLAQSLTINCVQRALPTLLIFIDSRESLKELQITTLRFLSAATGHEYSEEYIFKKIYFAMTASTLHNL